MKNDTTTTVLNFILAVMVILGVCFALMAMMKTRELRQLTFNATIANNTIMRAASLANDTAAYFTGRFLGRHKLYPAISPSKTVEGAVGGLFGGLAAAIACRATFFPALTLRDCLMVAVPGAVIGPIGDLLESMIKRSAGVKDSGRMLPGHGGILDRVDALLFVTAWIYAYTTRFR